MLGLVSAMSNAPAMYRPVKDWQTIYDTQTTEGIPPPNELEQEDDKVMAEQAARVTKAVDALRAELKRYAPDVLVVLGYDDGTCFGDAQVPQFCTYTGAVLDGSAAIAALGEKPDDHKVSLDCVPDFAWELQTSLVDKGFDMNYMTTQNPLGDTPEFGTTSAFTRPTPMLLEGLDIPIVPIFINCHVEPTPSGGRCFEFGQALSAALQESLAKVAVLAVGGLSHDPNGMRAGWIDNRLDNFVLRHMAKGDTARLTRMFDVDSDTVRGGTGQIRTWLAAAAAAEAQGGKATVIDYIPALRTMTGLGFAHWKLDG